MFGFIGFVGGKEDLRTFPGDSLGGADPHTFAAANAFLVAGISNIYLAFCLAKSAMGAFGVIHLNAENGDFVEQSVQRAKGTDETAEQPENEHAADNNAHH